MNYHYHEEVLVPAEPSEVFAFADDHSNFSSHMTESSWMMMGGKMQTEIDDKHGQEIGSHIKMEGRVAGLHLYLDEVVVKRDPPRIKEWQTIDTPKLMIIGAYILGFEIGSAGNNSRIRIYIDYDLPKRKVWLGKLFGRMYAKWCVKQMMKSITSRFGRIIN